MLEFEKPRASEITSELFDLVETFLGKNSLIPDSGIKYEQALKETLLFSKLKAIIAQRKL